MRQSAWRYLLVLVVVTGCATGRLSVTGQQGELQFSFDDRGKPVVVSGIEVYDFDRRHRGETLCQVRSKSQWADDLARLNGWVYGHEIAKYTVSACPKLETGRQYGANVTHSSHCIMSIVFILLPDGTVRTLEPGFDSCWM